MSNQCPTGIHIAHKCWTASKPKHQLYYGHFHTAPTCKDYYLQKVGLVISNAIAIHIRDAKTVKLLPFIANDTTDPPTATDASFPLDPAMDHDSLEHLDPDYDPLDDLLDGPIPDPTDVTPPQLQPQLQRFPAKYQPPRSIRRTMRTRDFT